MSGGGGSEEGTGRPGARDTGHGRGCPVRATREGGPCRHPLTTEQVAACAGGAGPGQGPRPAGPPATAPAGPALGVTVRSSLRTAELSVSVAPVLIQMWLVWAR